MERLWKALWSSAPADLTFDDLIRRLLDITVSDSISPWLSSLSSFLITEDQSLLTSFDYAPHLSFTLEAGFFNQLITVFSAVFPRSHLPSLYSFFTSLWTHIHNQPLIPHEHFNQPTLRILTLTLSLWPPENHEIELLEGFLIAIFERLEENSMFESLFLTENRYFLLEIVEKLVDFLEISEKLVKIVTFCLLPEENFIIENFLLKSTLGTQLTDKMRYFATIFLSNPLKTTEKTQILLISSCFNTVFNETFSVLLIKKLQNELFSGFFVNLKFTFTRGNWKSKSELLILLANIAEISTNEHFSALFSAFLLDLNSISEQISSFSWENRTFWSYLHCGKESIRIFSLNLLYILVGKMHWNVILMLFSEEIQGNALENYLSPDDFVANFPFFDPKNTEKSLLFETFFSSISSKAPIFHEKPEICTENSLLIDYFLVKLERIWENSWQENALLTGIISKLCVFPGFCQAGRRLHRRLLGNLQENRGKCLFSVLKNV